MLHVQRRVDVDPGGEQLVHILPPLGVPRTLGVRVRQFIHQYDLRTSGQRRVEIELAERDASIFDEPRRQDLQSREQRFGLGPSVQLDVADKEVRT